MAYDSVENVVILFGGITSSEMTVTNDTWIFDCDTREWTEVHPSVVPLARYGHVMTYDMSINKAIMAFGNNYDVGFLNDTFTYDVSTNTWSEIECIGAPGHLKWPSMVYDSINGRNILFGGCIMYPSYAAVDDTLVFDAETSTWTNLEPAQAPEPRLIPGLAFDSKHGVVVLHGGINAGGDTKFGDTWIYSYASNRWTETSQIPSSITTSTISGTETTLSTISTTETSTTSRTDTTTVTQFPDPLLIVISSGVIGVVVIVVILTLRKRN
jgi:N-acetylneuraminic acid mutarotase